MHTRHDAAHITLEKRRKVIEGTSSSLEKAEECGHMSSMFEREQSWRLGSTSAVVVCCPRWRCNVVTFKLSCLELEDNVFVVISATTMSINSVGEDI